MQEAFVDHTSEMVTCHGAVMQVAAALCELMIPYYTSKIIFAVTQQVPMATFHGYLSAYAAFAGGFALLAAGRGALFSVINNRLSRALRCVLCALAAE